MKEITSLFKTFNKSIIILIVVTSINSCQSIKQGNIVERRIIPARTIYSGKVYNQVKEKYYVIIEGMNKRGKIQTKKVYISKSKYNKTRIGDNILRKSNN